MKVLQWAKWRDDCGTHYFWRAKFADYQPATWYSDQTYRFIYPCRKHEHSGSVVSWLPLKLSSRLRWDGNKPPPNFG